jgi:hypothetical protein
MGAMCTTRSYVMLPSEKSSLRAVVITRIKNYFPAPAVPSTLSCFNLQNNILLFTLQHVIDNFRYHHWVTLVSANYFAAVLTRV